VAVFDLIAPVLDLNIHAQCDAINNHYFKDETATEKQAYDWLDKNIGIFTAATQGDDAFGFFEILPITKDCAARIEQGMTEEDITPDDIIAYEDQGNAEYAYISAVAVAKTTSRLFDLSCAAALASGICSVFLYGYDRQHLKKIYSHTISPEGKGYSKNFGFETLQGTGFNVTQCLTLNTSHWTYLKKMQRRYDRFVLHNAWMARAENANIAG
jgi:hypothetical protein